MGTYNEMGQGQAACNGCSREFYGYLHRSVRDEAGYGQIHDQSLAKAKENLSHTASSDMRKIT
jgi:hypothetical protein